MNGRPDFLPLADMSINTLKIRHVRREMPFHADEDGRYRYTPFDAFLTVLTDQLALLGISRKMAAHAVGANEALLREWSDKIIDPDGPGIMAAVVVAESNFLMGNVTPEEVGCKDFDPSTNLKVHFVVGPLAGLPALLPENLGAPEAKLQIHRMHTANASLAWRKVKERAAAASIDIRNVFGREGE